MTIRTEPNGIRTTFIGQDKVIVFGGRYFRNTERARDAACQAEWARGVLANPSVTYQNGRESHEVASEVLEKAEDTLIGYMVFTADQLFSAARAA
jgi:hypothetical protein